MILSIDLGATNIKAALFDENLTKLTNTLSVPTRADEGKAGVLSALEEAVASFGNVTALAVASAGDVDPETSRITYATQNLPGMTGFDFAAFGREHNLPAYAINDAQAALLGEAYCGAAAKQRDKNIAMLTLGSGVGGAYYSGGEISANEKNGFARFGHITLHEGGRECTCGKRGCIETYLSGRAIHRSAAEQGVDGGDIFEKYLSGDRKVTEFVTGLIGELNLALGKVNAVAPFDICIIGGGVADWFGAAFEKIKNASEYALVKAVLGNDAGLYGACVNMKKRRGEL